MTTTLTNSVDDAATNADASAQSAQGQSAVRSCPRGHGAAHGLSLSRIVAGMWRMNEWGMTVPQRVAFIEQCVDLGVTSFDHADIYGDYSVERLFGDALRVQPALRERIELVSKCGIKLRSGARPAHALQHYDSSASHIIASVEH